MRVALYARVSTTHQVQLQTIDHQLDRLRAYTKAQGWSLADHHVFRDDAYSGATLKRPGLDHLRDAVRNREVDRILLTSPDRLARNYVHQMLLLDEFAQAACEVDFLDRPMSQDPHDQLLLQIRGAVAEYERTLIAERMRRGRLAKLQAGLLLPWTRPPYGYRLHPDRPRDPSGVTIEPSEAAIVAELFAAYLQPGATLASLAKALQRRGLPTPLRKGGWTSPTIRGILQNPTYTGEVYAQRTRYREPRVRRSATHPIGRPHGTAMALPREAWILVGTVPAIVSHEQFAQVQAKLAQNQSFARRNNTAHQYLLRALVSCGHCQLACTARTENQRNGYYVCNGKGQSVHSHRATPCPARYIPAHQLDELVWQDVCTVLQQPAILREALERAHGGHWLPQNLQARRDNLRKAGASLRQQLERLTDAYLRSVIPLDEYERRRHDLEQKEGALADQAQQLAAEADRQREVAGLVGSIEAFCTRVCASLATASFEQKRELVVLLIDRVIVTDGDVEIRYVVPTTQASEHVHFSHLRKDYFHHPAPWQQHKAAFRFRQLHHLQPHALLRRIRCRLLARIALVHKRDLDAVAGDLLDRLRQGRDLGPLLRIGRRDMHCQQQAERVDREMGLAAFAPFVSIIARALTTLSGGLHRPSITDRGARLRCAPTGDADQHAEVVDHGFKHLRPHPALGLLIDRMPRGQIVGHHAPLGPRAHDPAQAVEHLAQRMLALGRSFRHQHQIGRDKRPFVIRDIRRVWLACWYFHTPSIPSWF